MFHRPNGANTIDLKKNLVFLCLSQRLALKVIRHVFGFGIEFFENKDIGIF